MHRPFWLPAFLLATIILAPPALAIDADGDGIDDAVDVCLNVPNPTQIDADGDGYGNACDGDFNQDGIVNFADLALLRQGFFQSNSVLDLSGDGVVNFADLAILRAGFFKAPGPKCAACPTDACARAKELLCPGLAIVAADDQLIQCLATLDPQARPQVFQTATFLRGLTRVARPAFELLPGPDPAKIDSIAEVLDSLGIGAAGRDPLEFMASLPLLPDGNCTVPEGVRQTDVARALQTQLLESLDAAIADLPAVQLGWVDHCNVNRFGRSERVELDGSDALLLRAHLHFLRAVLHLLSADDLDFDLGKLCTAFREGPLPTIESFLRDNPGFGTRRSSPAALAARSDLRSALDLLDAGLEAVRSETDPQQDDLAFVDALDPNGLPPAEEESIQMRLDFARAALQGPVMAPPGVLLPRRIAERICGDPSLDLGAFFDGPGLRPLLPPFGGNAPDVDAVPDPTFGGLFPQQQAGGLRCYVDEGQPVISFEPGYGPDYQAPTLTSQPVHIRIRFEDTPVGAGGPSPLDPASISVRLFTSPHGYGGFSPLCIAKLDGLEAARSDGFGENEVRPLFQQSIDPGGAILLEADLTVQTSGLPQGCWINFSASVMDVFANEGYENQGLIILERGPVFRVTPPYYSGPGPVAVSIVVGAPFGDVALTDARILASSFPPTGCPRIVVDGQAFALPQDPFGGAPADVTSLFQSTSGPGAAERSFSAQVSKPLADPPCSLQLGPVFPPNAYPFASVWLSFEP